MEDPHQVRTGNDPYGLAVLNDRKQALISVDDKQVSYSLP